MDIPLYRILATLPHKETTIEVVEDLVEDIDPKLRDKFHINSRTKSGNKKVLLRIDNGYVVISFRKEIRSIQLNGLHPNGVLSWLRFLWQLQRLRTNRDAWDKAFDFREVIVANQAILIRGACIPKGPEAERYTEPDGRIFGPPRHNAPVRQWKELKIELSYHLASNLDFNHVLFARLVMPSIYRDTGLTVYGVKEAGIQVVLPNGNVIGTGTCGASFNFQTMFGRPIYWMMDALYEYGKETGDPWIELNASELANHVQKVQSGRVLTLYVKTDHGVTIGAASFNLELFGYPGFVQKDTG